MNPSDDMSSMLAESSAVTVLVMADSVIRRLRPAMFRIIVCLSHRAAADGSYASMNFIIGAADSVPWKFIWTAGIPAEKYFSRIVPFFGV